MPRKIEFINGIRGVAILMVIWHHWFGSKVARQPPVDMPGDLLGPLVNSGHCGIRIFLVFSGFVPYLPHGMTRDIAGAHRAAPRDMVISPRPR